MDAAEWTIARNMAAALLAGPWTPYALQLRAKDYLECASRKSLRRLVRYVIENVPSSYPPSPDWLAACLTSSPTFAWAISSLRKKVQVAAHQFISGNQTSIAEQHYPENAPVGSIQVPPYVLSSAEFAPSPQFVGLDVPRLATPGDLAKWLDISIEQLEWLADSRCQHARTAIPLFQHYIYTFIPKRTGPPRLIEAPKPRLQAIQRRILREILDFLPSHDRAHGFVRGRSCISAAEHHAGEFAVVSTDLRDFFASTPITRVHGIFRSLGFPWAVARLLTRLCTTNTPASVFLRSREGRQHDWETRKHFDAQHLPQGAPTSPALANLAAWHLDQRLVGLSNRFEAHYTRYADDLAFSGDAAFALKVGKFLSTVERIARDEGYALNSRKTRIMHRSGCQRITGIVVNQHLNVPRKVYDELKAILHNCAKSTPQAQNRNGHRDFRAHLDGRIQWVEALNLLRGKRLRLLFDAIEW
jgi:RNA-directed DNA polymerase